MHDQTHTFIDSLLQSQYHFMQAMAAHRDQFSETMSSMAHTYLDTSIDRLKRFHDHVANDASGLMSDMLEATLKAAIDQHLHLKDRLTVHQHHANSHKQTLRRLAMGVMATFGVMSGVKAAPALGLEDEASKSRPSMVLDSISSDDADSSSSKSIRPDHGMIKTSHPDIATPKNKRSVQFAFPEISSVHEEVDDQTPQDSLRIEPKKVMNPYKSKTGKSEYEKKFALAERLKTRTSTQAITLRVETYLRLAYLNQTPLDKIYEAAQELDKLGDNYRHATLVIIDLMLVPSRNPSQREFLFAADVFKRIGVMDRVIELCLKAANHPKTSFWDFEKIIPLAKSDNPKYTASLAEIQAKAVRIFELKANEPNPSYVEILSVADCFTLLGEKYVNRAAELYEKGIVLAEEEFNDIKKYAHGLVRSYEWAEDGLKKLGEKYSNRVAEINIIVTALKHVIEGNYKDAEDSLRKIAQKYPQDSAEYIQYIRKAEEVSKD